MGYGGGWAPYVSVAERKKKAQKHAASLNKKGVVLNPIHIEGRKITKTFWGSSWCEHLESYSDFSNRLPRGRTYVRNGSVIDLQIKKGQVIAQVMGSSLYKVTITVESMLETKWKALVKVCAGKIDSLIELLQGKFSKAVMEILTEKKQGLFPKPSEIKMKCSCPDYANVCKHVAAVLYGVGAVLDTKPEALFDLRQVDHLDLITTASASDTFMQTQEKDHGIKDDDLSTLFGIEMEIEKSSKQQEFSPLKKPQKKIAKPQVSRVKKSTIGLISTKDPALTSVESINSDGSVLRLDDPKPKAKKSSQQFSKAIKKVKKEVAVEVEASSNKKTLRLKKAKRQSIEAEVKPVKKQSRFKAKEKGKD